MGNILDEEGNAILDENEADITDSMDVDPPAPSSSSSGGMSLGLGLRL